MKAIALPLALALTACGSRDTLSRIGRAPPLAPVETTVALAPPVPATSSSGSLFKPGTPSLFRELRAERLGDLVTVRIAVADRAELNNATERSRGASTSTGIPALLGLETLLPAAIQPSRLIEGRGDSSASGNGAAQRSERIEAVLAARVVAVVPGGLVIPGRQQVRVNHELRDLSVEGIIRAADIAPDNSISHTLIAEARISYGGRGTLSDVQQPRWGQQIVDALSPF